MCKQLWMGMEPQPLHNGMVCIPAVTQTLAFSWLPKQIWDNKGNGNGLPMVPYAHPLHMKWFIHIICAPHWCACSFGWLWSLKHCIMVWFVAQQWPKLSANCQNLGQQGQWVQTPYMCSTLMCMQLWMGMEPQPLHNGMVCSPVLRSKLSADTTTYDVVPNFREQAEILDDGFV